MNGSVYERVRDNDATLKTTSTIKGVQVALTSPQTNIADALTEADYQFLDTNYATYVPSTSAGITSNLDPYVTLFDPTSGWATVKAVFYPYSSCPVTDTESTFAFKPAYANESLSEDGIFVIRVIADDDTIKWYAIYVVIS